MRNEIKKDLESLYDLTYADPRQYIWLRTVIHYLRMKKYGETNDHVLTGVPNEARPFIEVRRMLMGFWDLGRGFWILIVGGIFGF